jgi:PadR family transcriptional regulator PadR
MSNLSSDILKRSNWEAQLRKGSLALAALAALWEGRLYGLEILRRLSAVAGLDVPEGTIYPLLNRMRTSGFVTSVWVEADAGHPRKYYELTPSGRLHLREIAGSWLSFTSGVNRLLAPIEELDRAQRDAG